MYISYTMLLNMTNDNTKRNLSHLLNKKTPPSLNGIPLILALADTVTRKILYYMTPQQIVLLSKS